MLFQHFLPGIAQELEAQGHEWSSREDMPAEVWRVLKQREALKCTGSRMRLCRFQSVIMKPEQKVGEWHIDLLERTVLSLEADMLHGKKFKDKFKVKVCDAEDPREDGGTTNPLSTTFESRAFKSACQNAVVVSVMTLSDLTNLRLVRGVLAGGLVVKAAHGHQNKVNRSSHDCCDWFLRQALGDMMKTCSDTVAVLMSADDHRDMSLVLPSKARPFQGSELEEINDDHVVQTIGMFTIALAGHVARRALFVHSWPWAMVKVLEPAAAAGTMELFRKDLAIWRALSSREEMTKEEMKIRKRHLFSLTSNRQYIEADAELNGSVTEKFLSVVKGRHTGCFVTQAVEDMIGMQKNHKQLKGKKKLRTPARSFASALSSNVVSERHHFRDVAADVSFGRQQLFLDKDAFISKMESWSLNFRKVQSTSDAPSWYSPGATTWITPCADLVMLRAIDNQGLAWCYADLAWMGCLLTLEHLVVFRYTQEPSKTGYYMGLQHIESSCLLCWPVVRYTVPGHSDAVYFDPVKTLLEPCLLLICEIKKMEACKVEFRSPLWQWQHFPKARGLMIQHTRLFANTAMMPLPNPLAQYAFFNLNRSIVDLVAEHLGYEVPAGCSLFDLLVGIVLFILLCTQEGACDILKRRLVNSSSHNDLTSALMEIDDITLPHLLEYTERGGTERTRDPGLLRRRLHKEETRTRGEGEGQNQGQVEVEGPAARLPH